MARNAFLLPLAALALAPLAGAQTFTYSAAALPGQTAIWTDGVCIADIDNDGDNDLVFANGSVYGGTGTQGAAVQQLWLNNGLGTFAAANANLNVANFNAKMVIAHDFDGDGDLDLFYASGSTGSPPRLLINQGGAQAGTVGIFMDQTVTNVPALALRSFSVCAGDVDNDGDLDVVVNDGGTFGGTPTQAHLLLNNGSAVFTDVTAAQLPADLYNCQDIQLLDIDGDFDIDIALNGKVNAARVYLNNGSGTFTTNAVMMPTLGSAMSYEFDYGDLDGDNDFDVAVQSITGSSEGWARNNGTAAVMTEVTFPAPNGDDDNEMALLDFDNDGDLDVFVGSLGSSEKVYRNTNAVFAKDTTIIQAQGDSTLDFGIGDLNGDGRYDMVTGQGESNNFTNKVYFNSGAQDTLPPELFGSNTPSIGNPETVFHMRLGDAISDDGVINVSLTYLWKTNLASGSGTSLDMGTGLFRSPVPTPPGTAWVWINCTATDSSGNSASFGPTVIGTPPNPWTDLGFGLAGVSGIPSLVGTGPLLPGTIGMLSLTNAKPAAPSLLFVSLASTPIPFKGGTLAAFPFFLAVNLPTNGAGAIPLPFAWPTGVPRGVSLYFQYAVSDAAGVAGASLSNAVQGIAQ